METLACLVFPCLCRPESLHIMFTLLLAGFLAYSECLDERDILLSLRFLRNIFSDCFLVDGSKWEDIVSSLSLDFWLSLSV